MADFEVTGAQPMDARSRHGYYSTSRDRLLARVALPAPRRRRAHDAWLNTDATTADGVQFRNTVGAELLQLRPERPRIVQRQRRTDAP